MLNEMKWDLLFISKQHDTPEATQNPHPIPKPHGREGKVNAFDRTSLRAKSPKKQPVIL